MFFEFLGHKVHYEVDGEGKPLIVLNGIMMSTKSWRFLVPSFKEAHIQLITVDFFDQGESDNFTEYQYRQDLQADLVKALIDHLQLKQKPVIYGVSYGGEVSILFAEKYHGVAEKFILCNTGAWTNPWLKDIGDGWNSIGRTRDGDCYYNITIPVVYSPQYYDGNQDWMTARKNLLAPGVFSSPAFLERMERLVHSSETLDARANLKDITEPCLIVTSEYDMLLPRPQQKILHENIPHNSWALIPEAGHGFMYEDTELLITLMIGWVYSRKETV